ncbi:MAG: DUF4962 domain-containing protein [bacterium]|nr:DUF4962 domain-containing protein [bacterium]
MYRTTARLIAFVFVISLAGYAQDAQELQAEREANARLKGEHPLVQIARTKPSSLRKELAGVHPRVYLTQADIDQLKEKAKTHPELWQTALSRVRALTVEPAPAPAQERRVQNEVGLGIAEAAFAYKMTGDRKYFDAAMKYIDAGISYEVWGYTYNKPDVDLAAGHLLYGMGWGYDLLYNDLTPDQRTRIRNKLVRQARLLHDFFKIKNGKSYAYSQNHTFIPISGLAITAYALMDEVPEAKEWAATSRAIFDRVLATLGEDGYFYESMEYWIFSMPWIVHYMDAHAQSTGEDLYKGLAGLENTHKFIAHITLPGGEFNFDYGDIYAGPITRARKGNDYARERIDGRFRTNYNLLYNLASRYRSGEAQGVADWVKSKGQVNAEEMWSFIWYNPKIKAVPIHDQPKHHWFKDHGVVFWRSSWDDDATAWSFKAGPPEGHAATAKVKAFPDWRLSSGHAHPDAGGFIIWSNGRYLTGDSGYAGVPMTEHHNTVTFDGLGQAKEGKGHDAFAGVSYDLMNRIRVTDVNFSDGKVTISSDLKAAYVPEIGVEKFTRLFTFTAPYAFLVEDEIKTSKPRKIVSYLHSDNAIVKSGGGFEFEPGNPSLMVDLIEPKGLDAIIEKNILTAPGRPGSVDKGEREERGVRLAVSPKNVVSDFSMKARLTIRGR